MLRNRPQPVLVLTLLLFAGCQDRGPEQVSDAIEAGDLSAVQRLVSERPELLNQMHQNVVDQGSPGGTSSSSVVAIPLGRPLHRAFHERKVDIARWLIEQGADVDGRGYMDQTPLMIAAKRSTDGDLLDLLLENGADGSLVDSDGQTALHYAASLACCDTGSLAQLLALGHDANVTDDEGGTPLHTAARNGFVEGAAVLCGYGANPEATNEDGQTPGALATSREYTEMAAWFEDPLGCGFSRELWSRLPTEIREEATGSFAGCVAGNGRDCNRAGVLLGNRNNGSFDRPLAERAYLRGCALDHALSCQNAALAAAAGWSGEAEPERARSLNEKACTLGAERSCERLEGNDA